MIKLLTLRYIKYSITRTILVVLAILFSCSAITVGAMFLDVNHKLNIVDAIKRYGAQTITLTENTPQQLDEIRKNEYVEQVGELIEIEKLKDTNKIIMLQYVDECATKLRGIKLQYGSWPKLKNEVAIEEWLLKEKKLDNKDNNKIILNNKSFIIKGVLESQKENLTTRQAQVIISEQYIKSNLGKNQYQKTLYIRFKDKYLDFKFIEKFGQMLHIDMEQISVNNDLLARTEKSFEPVILPFILALSIFTCITIYSIMNIVIQNKLREFGLLSLIGMTRAQLKRMVRFEGILLGIIGIPLGLASGYLMGSIFLRNMSKQFSITLGLPTNYIILIIVFTAFAIHISLLKTFRIIKRISPVSFLNYNQIKTTSDKALSRNIYFSKINIIFSMSVYYLLRNKKRTIFTAIIMLLSCITMFSFIILTSAFMNSSDNAGENNKWDFELVNSLQKMKDKEFKKVKVFDQAFLDSLKAKRDIMQYSLVSCFETHCNFEKSKLNKLYTHYYERNGNDINDFKIQNTLIFGYDDFYMSKIDSQKNKDMVIIYNDKNNPNSYVMGDTLSITVNTEEGGKEKRVTRKFLIGGITDMLPYMNEEALIGGSNLKVIIVMRNEALKEFFNYDNINMVTVFVKGDNAKAVESYLGEVIKKKSEIILAKSKDANNKIRQIIRDIWLLVGTIFLCIFLIGLLTMINTTAINYIERIKELKLLNIIGMTDGQKFKMLFLEGLCLIIVSTFFGLFLAYNLTNRLFVAWFSSIHILSWSFDILWVGIAALLIVVLQAFVCRIMLCLNRT